MRRIHRKALPPFPMTSGALDENPRAKAFFATLTGSTRYAFLHRLHHVTDAEKRTNRIAQYLRLLSERRTLS